MCLHRRGDRTFFITDDGRLLCLLQAYIKIYQGEELPEPKTMLQVSCQVWSCSLLYMYVPVLKYRLLLSFMDNDCKPEIDRMGAWFCINWKREGGQGAAVLKSCGNWPNGSEYFSWAFPDQTQLCPSWPRYLKWEVTRSELVGTNRVKQTLTASDTQ